MYQIGGLRPNKPNSVVLPTRQGLHHRSGAKHDSSSLVLVEFKGLRAFGGSIVSRDMTSEIYISFWTMREEPM